MPTVTESAAKQLYELFVHRSDVYPRQTDDGDGYTKVIDRLTESILCAHINKEITVGAYQLGEGDTVRWGCIDFDAQKDEFGECNWEDCKPAARAIMEYARSQKHPRMYAEMSGSKGLHLWVFLKSPTNAGAVQAELKKLVANAPITAEDRRKCREIAVFPKQTRLTQERPLGNLVKLPWGIHRKTGVRSVFLDENLEPLTGNKQLRALDNPELWEIKHEEEIFPQIEEPVEQVSFQAGSHAEVRLPCWEEALARGVDEGQRDNIVFSMANVLRREGVSRPVAESRLQDFNAASVRPPLDESVVSAKIRMAFANHGGIGCERIQSAGLCPAMSRGASCPVWDKQLVHSDKGGFRLKIVSKTLFSPSPKWSVSINGASPFDVSHQSLVSWNHFKADVTAHLNFVPILDRPVKVDGRKLPPQTVWDQVLNEALAEDFEIITPPSEASEEGTVMAMVSDFVDRVGTENDPSAVTAGRCYQDDHSQIWFLYTTLREWLIRHHCKVEPNDLYGYLKKAGGNSKRLRVDGVSIRAWVLPMTALGGGEK